MTELEEQITAFVCEQTGTDAVQLDYGLTQDFGVDGDDADQFFENFCEEFHVDLTALQEHWCQHFSREMLGPPLGCWIVVGAAVAAGSLLHIALDRIPAWALIVALVTVFGWMCRKVFNYYRRDEKLPITVQDLVEAAAAGKWVKRYEQSWPNETR